MWMFDGCASMRPMHLDDVISATREWVAMEARQQRDFGVRRPLPESIKRLHEELSALMAILDGGLEVRGEGSVSVTAVPPGDRAEALPTGPGERPPAPAVPEGGKLSALTLPDAIGAVMQTRDPVRISELLLALEQGDKPVPRKRLENTLQRLTKEQRLVRVRPGVYASPASQPPDRDPV